MSSSKVKILLVGTIGDNVSDFLSKISSLQQSKAGPFDACFCVGPCSPSILSSTEIPLPVYLQDSTGLSEKAEGLVELAPNLYCFAKHAQVHSLDVKKTQLVVVSCPPRVQWDSESSKQLRENLSHVSYVGCDLLLTSEWPQGIESLLQVSDNNTGAYDVAEVALRARARYHVAPSPTKFHPSPPFAHLAASSSTFVPQHVGRFLGLANVVSPSQFKKVGKTHKFVHALGLTPLQYMTTTEIQTTPSVQPCPYTDASYQTDGAAATSSSSVGLSEAQARRLLAESNAGDSSHNRWVTKKRSLPDEEGEVDTTNRTLFCHGLHKDVRGVLQTSSAALLQHFAPFSIEKVRRPPSAATSFCFLEFPSHELARTCLETLGGETTVVGIHLTLKWATHSEAKKKRAARLMEKDAMDSYTLYFKLPSSTDMEQASEDLRKWMESTLEQALGDPDVTAAKEPALQVKMRLGDKNFGFLEFASHAAASMAVATLTGSTDGGIVLEENESSTPPPPHLLGVVLNWAQNAVKPLTTESGIVFERRHFPADSRTDCWFCLASPTCEKHLITSVHKECYICMPKGPLWEGHVLIVPVTHSSKGALVDAAVSNEMEHLKTKLRQHAMEVWNKDLFVFERAMETKGGYHTHVQCIPIERGLGMKLQTTMMSMSRGRFSLRELNSDVGLKAIAGDGGYFYAEVPISSKEYKRFLYSASDEDKSNVVPLQFGREVLAAVMDNPDLAHWKACVMDKEKETELANAFRESFAKYENE